MRITLATIKAFIRKNRENLYIDVKSTFDGMVDCVMPCGDGAFTKALTPDDGYNHQNKLGIQGAWFVLGGGDRFYPFEKDGFKGYEVYNCCGTFILAVPTV